MEKKHQNQYATTEMFTAADGKSYSAEFVLKGINDNCRAYAAMNGKDFEGGDMDDTFQNSAMKFWVSKGSYDPSKGAGLSTYGSRIAGNCEKDEYKKETNRRSRFSSIDEAEEAGCYWEAESTTTYRGDEFEADYDIRKTEAEEYINTTIVGLSKDYRIVINLLSKGYSSEEIADELVWGIDKTYRMCCRARKALAKALGKDFLAENGFSRL